MFAAVSNAVVDAHLRKPFGIHDAQVTIIHFAERRAGGRGRASSERRA